jgi:YggT family protein
VGCILASLLSIYLLVLVVRAVLSWFPISPGSSLAPIVSILYNITEPVLAPLRRVIPPVGGFDLSFIVALFAIEILQRAIASNFGCTGGLGLF